VSDSLGMPITSTDAGKNANTAASAFEANRAQDPYEAGKETTTTKGKNAGTAANLYEARTADQGNPGGH
jgi:hypothetical protein